MPYSRLHLNQTIAYHHHGLYGWFPWIAAALTALSLGMALLSSSDRYDAFNNAARPSDMLLAHRVRVALHEDPATSARAKTIHVSAHSGQVVLRGMVMTRRQAELAIAIAGAVKGVRSIRDELMVIDDEELRPWRYIA
jgi:osmotically-inducible protein OsmY